MGLLKGAMSVRRFQVLDSPPEKFILDYVDAFHDHAFRSTSDVLSEEVRCGWSTIHNLLDQDFSDIDRWYAEPYIFAMMRVDKKSVPSNYLRAKVKQKVEDWCAENNKERVPAKVKREIKETIKNELLSKTLPKVKTIEFCWNVKENYLILHSTSKSAIEQFYKLFFETFGIGLDLFYPSLFIPNTRERGALESASMSDVTHKGESS